MASLKSNRKGLEIFPLIILLLPIAIIAILFSGVLNPGGDGDGGVTDTTDDQDETEPVLGAGTDEIPWWERCHDTDQGRSFLAAGKVTVKDERGEREYIDYCESDDLLVEYFCERDYVDNVTYSCTSYLSSYRCTEDYKGWASCRSLSSILKGESICIDTDDSQPDDLKLDKFGHTYGMQIGYGEEELTHKSYHDVCASRRTIKEYGCMNKVIVPYKGDCPEGTMCQNGECIDSDNPHELLECEDGTLQDRCSRTKPYLCKLNIGSEGMTVALTEECLICECLEEQECNPETGECSTYCGDGVCRRGETVETCFDDCVEPCNCRDGFCRGVELFDNSLCWADCDMSCLFNCVDTPVIIEDFIYDSETESVRKVCIPDPDGRTTSTGCGDGYCNAKENSCNCPEDCPGEIGTEILEEVQRYVESRVQDAIDNLDFSTFDGTLADLIKDETIEAIEASPNHLVEDISLCVGPVLDDIGLGVHTATFVKFTEYDGSIIDSDGNMHVTVIPGKYSIRCHTGVRYTQHPLVSFDLTLDATNICNQAPGLC